MKVTKSLKSRVLEPCTILNYKHQLDPYKGCEHLCCYCYGLNRAETNWEEELLIHENLPAQLETELALIEPQTIYIGMNSDPYQQSEIIHCQTRKALEALAKKGFSVSILTKSSLIIRDIDLFNKMPSPSAGISVAFTDETVRKRFEKNAPPTATRIRALKILKEAGIRTYTLICPILPHITNIKALIEQVEPYSIEIWAYSLKIDSANDPNWIKLKGVLEQHYPDLTETYKEIVFAANHDYWHEIRSALEQSKKNSLAKIFIEV